MTVTQKGIAALLKSAVTQEKVALPDGFSLEEAYPLVKEHHMSTLIYDGAVRCGIDRKSEVMGKLFREYIQMLRISERQMEQVGRVFAAFEENNIDYMPLKGCKMKALYPKPELRIMGDADILIRMEQYEQIKPIMHALGFTPEKVSDYELGWQNEGLHLELHKRIIPSYNKDFYEQLGDGWHLAKYREGCRYSMGLEEEFAYLFTHFVKHYRNGGIGCRHVVDLWVFLRSHPELNEMQVAQKLEKVHLLEFYNNFRRMTEVWFMDAEADEKTDFISEFIFSCGSWGVAENYAFGVAMRNARFRSGKAGKSKAAYVLYRIFPTVDELKGQYPVLEHRPWMLPAIWIVRVFRKMFVERGSVARQRKLIATFDSEKLDARQQALNYVGLDYNF